MNEPTKLRRMANLETRLDVAVEALEAAIAAAKLALHRGDALHADLNLSYRKALRLRGDVKMRLIELRANEE